MAFGGTAKTYATWELIGEPFKEGKVEYIFVRRPGSSTQKKVRWYSDKAHAALMPNQEPQKPIWTLFGFESEDDYIIGILQRDLSEQEEQDYFYYNWKKGGKWTGAGSAFLGGAWTAPKTAEIPPIRNQDKIFRIYWPQFKAAAQKYAKKEFGRIPPDWA